MASVLVEKIEDIHRLTLNRPEKLNALDADLLEELAARIAEAQTSRVMVLSGAGRSFCAGADVKSLAQLSSSAARERHARALEAVFLALSQSQVPVIAAVQGHALGAGAGLVACCHMVIAHDAASFGFPELGRGILPALVTPPLVAAIGARQARALLLSARLLSSSEVQSLGLVSEVTRQEPLQIAMERAKTIAAAPPKYLHALSRLIDTSGAESLPDALAAARQANIAARS